jgi:hypothetical protein
VSPRDESCHSREHLQASSPDLVDASGARADGSRIVFPHVRAGLCTYAHVTAGAISTVHRGSPIDILGGSSRFVDWRAV